ncbi:MAG: UbiA family prenyltransferase [Phycisphaeraceae bacterium]
MSTTPLAQPAAATATTPLCVDMDGTLLVTDTAWESLLGLLRTRPWLLVVLVPALLRGRAGVKRRLAELAPLDPADLPYRPAVLDHIREQRAAGRRVWLTTGADGQIARAVAAHLGLFDGVIASDGRANRTGAAKAAAIGRELEGQAFEYFGNAWVDVPIWDEAERAHVVNPSRTMHARLAAGGRLGEVIDDHPPGRRAWHILRAMRVHQWVKNILLAVPMLVGQQVFNPVQWGLLLAAFVAFSLCASAVYLINDLLDLPADRQHPNKRRRPFASGALSIPDGLALVPALLLAGLVLAAAWLPAQAVAGIALYVVLAMSYSLAIKGRAILDVIWLAGLYALRLIIGGVAVAVFPSAWLLGFAMFVFLSVAFVKRYTELVDLASRQGDRIAGRDYRVDDINLIGTIGPVNGYLAVVIFALYITSDDVQALYNAPELLWLACPLLIYWLTRLWLKAHRGILGDDPVMFTVKDPLSYIVGAALGGVVIAASL